ncbi:MAG: type IX secretion system membrane protein PorP/SprF [Sphingobacteriales bacterium]|nr:MAG: type IX secretion system membrane protein PorP/SprF [Sphingobacteriales bacterium]
MKKLIISTISLVALFFGRAEQAAAQVSPLTSQYFTNTYLSNPAMAGQRKGLSAFAAYLQQFSGIPGAPETQNVSANYGFSKVGVGIIVNNETAGLQRQTRVVGTFAYHVELNNSSKVHFGLSMGFLNQRIDVASLIGNPNDPNVGQYNGRDTYLDGDFGVAFTTNKLTLEAAIPNLKSFFKKDVVKLADVATFYSAIAYRFSLVGDSDASNIEVEPKVAFRGVQGMDNVWDGGAQLSFAGRQILLTGMYHSNESATFGLGMNFRKKYHFSGLYTTNTGTLNNYINGGFELNVGVMLDK